MQMQKFKRLTVGGDPLPNINMHGFGYQGDEVDVRRSRGNEPVLQVDLLLLDDRLLLVVLLAVPVTSQ